MTGVAAYGAFLSAEYLHVSGVLATVCAGLVMGSAGLRDGGFGISPAGRAFVAELWEFAAFVANSLVFLLIGLTVARIPFAEAGWGVLGRRHHPGADRPRPGRLSYQPTVCSLALAHFPARAACVVVGWSSRGFGAGLGTKPPASLALRDSVVIAAFAVVAFSVLVQGLTMTPLLRRLGLLSSRS